MLNRTLLATLLSLNLFLGGCGGGAPEKPPLAGAAIGGPFALTSDAGKPVKESDFAGTYRLVYFGYTFCPDVCPVDMQALMAGYAALEKQNAATAAKVQPLFITVDPVRDTPVALHQFVASFHPRLIGLTGDPAEITRVVKAYGAYAQLGEKKPDGSYLVNHTRNAMLFGPDGAPIAVIPHDKGPKLVAAELARWVK
ncbi:MAG: SCO family protein [Sphingomonadales bacterium]|jgi:protein SCO1/2|nr:SCO family protein [Sphingomonadales bacterium]